ncbi:MAG: hypothetical protein WC254_01645 [Candidatus Woesearchaeota archaeon]
MKTTIPIIVFCAGLSIGCSDYNLNNVGDFEDSGYITNDSGFQEDTAATLETYNSCNPYDVGWDVNPVGTERSSCMGIENSLLSVEPYGNFANFTTQVYMKDCGFNSIVGGEDTSTLRVIIKAEDASGNEISGFSYGLTNYNINCSTNDSSNQEFTRLNITPYESVLSSEFVFFNVWPISQTEYDSLNAELSVAQMSSSELETKLSTMFSIEPLKGTIDCRGAETVAECETTLYH